MNTASYSLIGLVLAAIPGWALISGKALGVWWWRTIIVRDDQPVAYWFVVAVQLAIVILFLATGRSWHLR